MKKARGAPSPFMRSALFGPFWSVHSLLAPGGLFLCSGIIDDRAEEVAEHLRQAGLEIVTTRSADGWFAYTCR